MYSLFVIFCSFLGYFLGFSFCKYIYEEESEELYYGRFIKKDRK